VHAEGRFTAANGIPWVASWGPPRASGKTFRHQFQPLTAVTGRVTRVFRPPAGLLIVHVPTLDRTDRHTVLPGGEAGLAGREPRVAATRRWMVMHPGMSTFRTTTPVHTSTWASTPLNVHSFVEESWARGARNLPVPLPLCLCCSCRQSAHMPEGQHIPESTSHLFHTTCVFLEVQY
jgi:hypothetical protein